MDNMPLEIIYTLGLVRSYMTLAINSLKQVGSKQADLTVIHTDFNIVECLGMSHDE
jgi:hypothetical protein